MTKAWRWVVLAAAGIAAYAAIAAWLAPHFTPVNDVRHGVRYDVAFDFPTRVAEGAVDEWRLLPALWGLVALLAWCCIRISTAVASGGRPGALIVAQLVVLAAGLLVTLTVSGDVYAYTIYGRLYGLYDVNPYLLGGPIADHGDATLRSCLAFYGNPPPGDNYGPLWTMLAGAIARIEATASLGVQVWTHRALAAIGAMAATAGILRIGRALPAGERLRNAALFAFHPLLIYEAAVGGHNDTLMVAAAIWAFALVDELPLFAGLLLGASIAVKYVSLLLVPFLAIRAWRRGAPGGAMCALVALAVPVLFFVPFWAGPATLYSLIGHGGIFDMSPLWLVNMPFFAAGTQNVPAFGGAIRLPLFGAASWPRLFELAASALVLAVATYSVIRYARTLRLENVWRSVTALLLSLPIIHPWYVTWLLPAAAGRSPWATYAWWFGILIFMRYALDAVAPAQAGPLFTPVLVVATLGFLLAPAVVALRDMRGRSTPREAA